MNAVLSPLTTAPIKPFTQSAAQPTERSERMVVTAEGLRIGRFGQQTHIFHPHTVAGKHELKLAVPLGDSTAQQQGTGMLVLNAGTGSQFRDIAVKAGATMHQLFFAAARDNNGGFALENVVPNIFRPNEDPAVATRIIKVEDQQFCSFCFDKFSHCCPVSGKTTQVDLLFVTTLPDYDALCALAKVSKISFSALIASELNQVELSEGNEQTVSLALRELIKRGATLVTKDQEKLSKIIIKSFETAPTLREKVRVASRDQNPG